MSILSLVLLFRVLAMTPEPFIYRARALQQPLLNEGVNHSGYRFNNMAREAMIPRALVTGVVSMRRFFHCSNVIPNGSAKVRLEPL